MRMIFSSLVIGLVALGSPVVAQADDALLKKGEKVFKKCKACHQVGEKAKNTVGPILNGVTNRQAGTIEGYKYSKAMIAAGEGGMVWDDANLDGYLTKPKTFIPKNKMSFVGLKKEKDRAAVIAYLKQFEAQ